MRFDYMFVIEGEESITILTGRGAAASGRGASQRVAARVSAGREPGGAAPDLTMPDLRRPRPHSFQENGPDTRR